MLKGEDSPDVFRKALKEQLYFVSKQKTLLSNNYQKIIFINESKCLQIIGCNFVQYLQWGFWFRLFLFQFRWTYVNYNSIAFICIQILMYEKGKVLWKKIWRYILQYITNINLFLQSNRRKFQYKRNIYDFIDVISFVFTFWRRSRSAFCLTSSLAALSAVRLIRYSQWI